jgi:hypothetical protein
MLNTLHIKQFTVFQDAQFEFSPGLNVIVGDNGTGKTHVLKLGYLFCRAWPDLASKNLAMTTQRAETYLGERLAGLFRVSDLGVLMRQRQAGSTRLTADVSGYVPTVKILTSSEQPSKSSRLPEELPWDIHIEPTKGILASAASTGTLKAKVVPAATARKAFLQSPVFVPSKEMVSLFPGLIGLFEKYREFPLDETYRDLAVAMSTLEPRTTATFVPEVMSRIQKLLGGDLKLDNGDLVFERLDGSRLASQLLAEGHRKLAMLIYLLRYGVIEIGSTVFWDEPEANLNPAAVKLLAEALYLLTGLGVQVILATHSLFLLREFEILQTRSGKSEHPPTRYFGLGWKRSQLEVSQGDDIADIDPLVMLDETLQQSDRYMEAER